MARPTKAEQERKRLALMADENATDVKIESETKTAPLAKGDYSISGLEDSLNNATMGNFQQSQEKKEFPTESMDTGDFSQAGKDDPDYVDMSKRYDPFATTIIQNESDANRAATASPTTAQTGRTVPPVQDFAEPIINGGSPIAPEPNKTGPEKPLNPELDNISPTERRKQTEMFADAILGSYAQYLPLIFNYIASYKMDKMDLLDKSGEIRLSMVIRRDENGDLTVREHFENFNKELAEIFEITAEEKEELREPLITVLSERGIAPTPTMTLVILLAKQAGVRIFALIKLIRQRSSDVEEFKRFRVDEVTKERTAHVEKQHAAPVVEKTPVTETPTKPKEEPLKMDDILSGKNTITPLPKNELAQIEQPGITIEEVMPGE